VTAARLFREAFDGTPALAADLGAGHRYTAACSAALAAAGQGQEGAGLDAQERARWRTQALEWLRADLTLLGKQSADSSPRIRTEAQQRLRHWQRNPNLAGVRDAAALAGLSEAEQKEWRDLWADVARTLGQDQ
jgi:hypothetical protein